MKIQHSHIQYRPDIDGLRALAVLSAIIFHMNSDWLPGGFLGVDMFFVISGYLITSIVKKQLDERRFTFRNFYTRRIKRILPLLFTVLFVTIIPAMFILLPGDFDDFTRSVRYAMQFRANRAFTGNDYFDLTTEEKPLLHLWSLAIEEQFYFIWPLVIFGAYFFTKRYKHQAYILFVLAVIGIIASTIAAEFSIKNDQGDSYYLLQNRAAELLVGCALALNPFNISRGWKKALGTIAIIGLIACLFLYSDTTPIPGLYALPPTLAVAFFILDNDLNSTYKKIFQNKIIRTIGLWSFSLYLWHWPLLAFPRYLSQDSDLPLSWLAIAFIATFVLAFITYNCVENPVRKMRLKFIPSAILIFLIPYGIVTGTYTLAQYYIQNSFLHVDNEKVRWFTPLEGCYDGISADCAVGDKTAETRYLLVGDSHATHLSSMMDEIGKKEHIRIDLITAPGCQVILGETKTKAIHPACAAANEYLFNNLENYDAVMITQFFVPNVLSNELILIPNYLERLNETLQHIAQTTPVIVIADVPAMGFYQQRNDRIEKLGLTATKSLSDEDRENNRNINAQIKAMTEKIPNAHFVDILPYAYTLIDQNELIYRDMNHLNPYGSRKLGKLFIENETLRLAPPADSEQQTIDNKE